MKGFCFILSVIAGGSIVVFAIFLFLIALVDAI